MDAQSWLSQIINNECMIIKLSSILQFPNTIIRVNRANEYKVILKLMSGKLEMIELELMGK